MVVLISKTTSGRRRTCSARCHNAKGLVCQCLCEGINHGVGLRQATENTQKMAEELLEHGLKLGTHAYQELLPI